MRFFGSSMPVSSKVGDVMTRICGDVTIRIYGDVTTSIWGDVTTIKSDVVIIYDGDSGSSDDAMTS